MAKFDYKSFAENMSTQAKDMLPADISKEGKTYTIKTIENFVILAGEALVNDKSLTLTAENQQAICQILAEWIFHKSIDLAHSEIPQENWDPILQKVAFTVFEIAKQAYIRDVSQEDILAAVEHHVNKLFKESLEELSKDNKITEEVQEKALKESNIDKMAKEYNNPKKENNKNFVLYSILKFVEPIIKIITNLFLFIKNVLAHIIKLYPFRSLMILSIFIIFKLTSKEIAENFTFSNFETLVYAVLILATLKIIFLTYKDWVNADVQNQLNQLEETKRNMEELVNPDRQFDRLGVDILSLSVGQGLLPIADPDNEEGTLLVNVVVLRQYLTDTLGYIIPNIRIMDTSNMENFEYAIFVRGNKVANGFVQPKHILVEESVLDNLEDKSIRENAISHLNPLTNEVAYWVDKYTAKDMELNGLEPADVIKEHLKKVVIKNVDKILTTSDVYKYFEQAKKTEFAENIINNLLERLDVEDVRKIFVNLIEEEVSIHNIVYILEKINAYSRENQEIDYISERIRIDLADYVSQNNANQGILHVIKVEESLDLELENKLYNDLRGIRFELKKDEAENLFNNFKKMLLEIREKFGNTLKIVILCTPKIRRALFKFLSIRGLDWVVISYPEVSSTVVLDIIDEIK